MHESDVLVKRPLVGLLNVIDEFTSAPHPSCEPIVSGGRHFHHESSISIEVGGDGGKRHLRLEVKGRSVVVVDELYYSQFSARCCSPG